jgi:DNA-damage-inducible protein J
LKRCNPRFRDIFPQKIADFSGQQIKPSRHAFVLQYVIQYAILKLRKVVLCMATKTSNVTARVEPEVKEQAETILSDLGIPVSTAINIFYRQIVLWNGLPFRPSVPAARLKSRSEMNDAEFNARMSAGYAQAKQNQAAPSDEVFDRLIGEIQNGKAV